MKPASGAGPIEPWRSIQSWLTSVRQTSGVLKRREKPRYQTYICSCYGRVVLYPEVFCLSRPFSDPLMDKPVKFHPCLRI